MTIWISVVIAGIINYLTRLGSVLLIKPERLSESAKKILGGKSEKAKVLLEECLQELIEKFDWTNNKVETKVKAGGDMIGGREHVCWYISYKNLLGLNTGFVYRQITPSEDPYIEVYSRRVGKNKDNNETIKSN